MITLLLLHPVKPIPAQVWSFKDKSVIRIGRSTDNHVILYSAVVSRHHVELRRVGSSWEIVNLGTNGTYVDGKRITQVPATDGSIIRLARSGPNIKIRLGMDALEEVPEVLTSDRPQGQPADLPHYSTEITDKGQPDELDAALSVYSNAYLDSFLGADGEALRSELKTAIVDDAPDTPWRGIIPVPPHLQIPSDSRIEAAPAATAGSEQGNDWGTERATDWVTDRVTDRAIAAASKTVSRLTSPLSAVEQGSECRHLHGGKLFCVDCGQPLRVLQTVDNYQLVQVLGRGEMGITYRAWRAGEHFTLKMLNASWAENPEARDALEYEAETLRHLNHPQIPQATDFFLVNQQPHLVMQWVEGTSLAQHIAATGAVPFAQAIAWILQVCNVLDYLHSFTPPLLHRGIKPSVLLCQPGASHDHTGGNNTGANIGDTVTLVDFGAIKSVALGQSIPPGSTGYAAPEQMELYATPATDLYALAPTLAFLLTGQNPVSFYADDGEGYRFCAQSVAGVPSALIDVMHTLTHRRPDDRYQSAQDVAAALKDIPLN